MGNFVAQNLIKALAEKIGLNEILTGLLVKRGFDSEIKLKEFLEPSLNKLTDPLTFKGMKEAVDIINKHINGGKILVFGDYDCDGIGASAILKLALSEHGADISVFIPTRVEDGYGLSDSSLRRAIETYKPTLIITVDCGIGSVEEVKLCRELGVEIIITDHHEPSEILPDCVIVNPKIQDEAPELCGCGVAYMLIRALYNDRYAEQFLDICAISTIADLVPLIGDNRIIAIEGLKLLSSSSVRTGIKSLLKVSGHRVGQTVSSGDVAFKLAPRLNASGRLSNAEKSLKLIIGTNAYEADLLAQELETENRTRQSLCSQTIQEARELLLNYDLVNNRIIVLHNENWEGGVIGIAAAKIAEEFKRPTVLFSTKNDIYKGSCRSISGINIHEVLSNAKDTVIQFGGHAMAAGLSIEPDRLNDFLDATNQFIKDNYSDELFRPSYNSDAQVDFKDINLNFVNQLKRLEPFGMGNPKPTFSAQCKALNFERIKRLSHVKCVIAPQVELIAFNEFEKLDILRSPMSKTIYFNPDKDVFMGKETVRCTYKDMIVNEIIPSDTDILISVAERYAIKAVSDKCKFTRSTSDALFGKLLICWSKDTYVDLINKYPDYIRILNKIPGKNPYNTILLAPRGTDNFDYYSEIEVFDNPPQSYVEALESVFSAKIKAHDNKLNINFNEKLPNRDSLIKLYNVLRHEYKDCIIDNLPNVYYKCSQCGYAYSFTEFSLAYYVLMELDITSINENNILRFSKEKKDLSQSNILKLDGGEL